MIPESKSLHLHELVHRQMPGLETRPDMSIKVDVNPTICEWK